MRYDVIVVGAGPSGSTAARECASLGLSALMLDKAEFPRDKPCGGAVMVRAANLLPFDLSPVSERTIFGMHLSRLSEGFTRRSPEELVYLTQRRHLDAFLAERAVDAGVTFRQRAPIRGVERHDTHVVVRTDDETFEASTLVAADGANGQTAKLAGVDAGLLKAIALEGNLTPTGEFPAEWEDVLGLDLGHPSGGYGWIFPKGDHLNIGLGGWQYLGPSLRSRLNELVRFYGFDPAQIWGVRGHHLPMRSSSSPLVDGNFLLVGDAAGLLDPMTGEGIHAAIWSGRAAAKHLAAYAAGEEPDLAGYRRDVEEELVSDLRVARRFHDLFHLTPGMYLGIEQMTSILWRLICPIMRGEQTYANVMIEHPFLGDIVEFVSDLVRVSPFLQRRSGLRDPVPPSRFFVGDAQHQ